MLQKKLEQMLCPMDAPEREMIRSLLRVNINFVGVCMRERSSYNIT